jgi:hypothetical protein
VIRIQALTIIWMTVEAAVSLGAAWVARSPALVCGYMALIALVGLIVNATWRVRWADPVAALALLPLILREGWEAMKGNPCCDESRPYELRSVDGIGPKRRERIAINPEICSVAGRRSGVAAFMRGLHFATVGAFQRQIQGTRF